MSCPEDMTGESEGFEKNGWVKFRLLKVAVGFFRSDQIRLSESWPAEMSLDLRHHKMHHALGEFQLRMVSIGFYELCLSSCHQGLKPKRNKPVHIRNNRVACVIIINIMRIQQKGNFFLIMCKPDGIASLFKIEWYCYFFMIPLTGIKYPTPKHHYTITDPPP